MSQVQRSACSGVPPHTASSVHRPRLKWMLNSPPPLSPACGARAAQSKCTRFETLVIGDQQPYADGDAMTGNASRRGAGGLAADRWVVGQARLRMAPPSATANYSPSGTLFASADDGWTLGPGLTAVSGLQCHDPPNTLTWLRPLKAI